jgi:IS4 transposase
VFSLSAAFFVVRTKKNILLERRYSHEVDKSTGVRADQTVILTAIGSIKAYPEALRRVSYVDPETNKRFAFLTNNFVLPALTITQIYKSRGQVELFFKWIKQHLRIKAFYGDVLQVGRTTALSGLSYTLAKLREMKHGR